MAERRMFAKTIVLSDAFLDMPMSARCLYFTLGMLADDDGFVGSPKSIMRQCGATQDDMAILLTKRFVLGFETGVIVIKHWRINNYLQNDRHKDTIYKEEMDKLNIKENGSYTMENYECIQPVYIPYTQDSIDKISIGKNSIGKNIIGELSSQKELARELNDAVASKTHRFVPPTYEEVQAYCNERNNNVDAERFVDFYTAKGWKVGKNKMTDWKAAVRTWEKEKKQEPKKFNELEKVELWD